MKFSTPLALVCAAGSAFSLVIERDLATVSGVLADVQSNIDSLDKVVKAFSGDPKPVTDSSGKLVIVIQNGDTKVKASGNLTSGDSINLISPVQDLKKHAQALTADLKAQKDAIQKAKGCDITRTQISSINTASQSLITTIVSKVPQSLQGVAKQQAQGITDTLTDAQNAFSTANCKNAA